MITNEQFEKAVDALAVRLKEQAARKGKEYDRGGGQFKTAERSAELLNTSVSVHLMHLMSKHFVALCGLIPHVGLREARAIKEKIDDLQVYLIALRLYVLLGPERKVDDEKA